MASTIKDVAERAGVSAATVSYVLNESAPVSQRTRERVLAAVAALDYRPSYQGRSLRGRQSKTIGLLLPGDLEQAEDLLPIALLAGLSASTAAAGYHLLLTGGAGGSEERCHELVSTGRVDGMVIIAPDREDRRLTLLERLGLAHACLGKVPAGSQSISVRRDVRAGALRAISYLAHAGHRRIGLIQQPQEQLESVDWYIGYRRGLRAAGIPFQSELVVEGAPEAGSGYSALEALLAQAEPPSAVLACTTELALGALSAAHDARLVVGRELALVSSGDTLATAGAQPPLTTLRWPDRRMGEALGELLIAQLAGEPASRQALFEPQLIVRASSA